MLKSKKLLYSIFSGRHPRYRQKIMGLFGASLVGYWPFDELSGTIAYDLVKRTDGNLVDNPGFELAGTGGADAWANWTESPGDGAITDETTIVHAGGSGHSAKLTCGASANTKITQALKVLPGATYILSFWTRGDGTFAGRYGVIDDTHSSYILGIGTTSITGLVWQQVTYSIVVPTGCTQISLDIRCPGNNGGVAYFDDFRITSGSLNGIYSSVLLGQPGYGNSRNGKSVYFDGTSIGVNLHSADLISLISGAEGSLFALLKTPATTWLDNTLRYAVRFRADTNNAMCFGKAADNKFFFQYNAGGTNSLPSVVTTTTDWMHIYMTWSKIANALHVFFNGSEVIGSPYTVGTWAGKIDAYRSVVGSENVSDVSAPWVGWIQHVALANVAHPEFAALL